MSNVYYLPDHTIFSYETALKQSISLSQYSEHRLDQLSEVIIDVFENWLKVHGTYDFDDMRPFSNVKNMLDISTPEKVWALDRRIQGIPLSELYLAWGRYFLKYSKDIIKNVAASRERISDLAHAAEYGNAAANAIRLAKYIIREPELVLEAATKAQKEIAA